MCRLQFQRTSVYRRKKFCIPCTVRISTEVNEIFSSVRINICNRSKWFSEKQARYWSVCWLPSCIFCHLDLKSYPILIGFSYLCPLTDGHFTLTTHCCLSYKECSCEKSEQKLFSWILRQILFDSKDAVMPYCFPLRTWWLYKIHNVLANMCMPGVQASDQWGLQGIFFPFKHPSQP